MQVNNVKNQQSFGMAFKLQGNGAAKLADLLSSESLEAAFIKEIANPLNELKTDVIYDGLNLRVSPHKGECIDVLDGTPFYAHPVHKNTINYHVSYPHSQNKVQPKYYQINHGSSGDKIGHSLAVSPYPQFLSAREIAKDAEKQLLKQAQETQIKNQQEVILDEREQRLKNLFA